MNSPHIPSAVGITGLLGTITLSDINTIVAIAVGVATLFYLGVKIFKELRKELANRHKTSFSNSRIYSLMNSY